MKILIIGAGPAGATVAETVRRFDERSEIIMISDEPYPPYAPPACLEYLQTGREVHFWKGKDFTQRFNIGYRSGVRVTAVLPEKNEVVLSNDERLSYDQLVIGSGGRLYAPVEGADKEGVYNFKSLSAAETLLKRIRQNGVRSALIVGAGFIGVEIAILLRSLGVEVTIVEKLRVMGSMLDEEISDMVCEMLRDRNINVNTGPDAEAVAFTGKVSAEGVKMKSGEELKADLLVAATGIKPNIDFLKNSGIKTDWGILVDEKLRSNVNNIYAAGDVAETKDRITGEQYVHAIFPNAIAQGEIVGYNLLGWDMAYEGSERMNSLMHLGLPIIAGGHMNGGELCRRGKDTLRKIYLKNDNVVGFRLAGDVSAAGLFRTLMNKKVNVADFKHRLLQPGFSIGVLEGLAVLPLTAG